MKKIYNNIWLALSVILLLVVASACTSAPSTTTTTSTSTPTTTTTSTSITTTTSTTQPSSTPTYTIDTSSSSTLGTYLVDSNGMTLYWTTADSPGTSNVSGTTLTYWPVFYVSNITVPSSLNATDFGTITRSDGSMQTTFKNWPLYYYASDSAPGDTTGQGVAGKWSVVNPDASGPLPVTSPTTTTTTATTTTSTTTTTTSPTSTTTTSSVSGQTFQTLANAGQTIYSSTCAVCHGTDGGGTQACPVVMWGPNSNLGTYSGSTLFTDADGMLNFMSKSMPLTAPGSLTSQQYISLLAYILTQDSKVSPSIVFDQSQLSSISIP